MQYRLTDNDQQIQRRDDNGSIWYIPNSVGNPMWEQYQEWLAEGNTPLTLGTDWE